MYTPHRPSLSTIASYNSREYHDQASLNHPNPSMSSKLSDTPPNMSRAIIMEEVPVYTEDYYQTKIPQYTTTTYAPVMPSTSPPPPSTTTTTTTTTSNPPIAPTSTTPQPRPQLARIPSVQTRYMEMLLHLDQIPRIYNILAGLFTWVLLAGFLVIPGTFTSFRNSDAFKNADADDANAIAHAIVAGIANIGLLWLSGIFCLVGGLGCLVLWLRWRRNYVWLINKIFLPALLNSTAGLLTTVVNVYTAQKGVWSVTAKITAIVTSSCVGVAGMVFVMYNFWILEKVREVHEREMGPRELLAREKRKKEKRESLAEKVKRKACEPALAPGSVV